MEGAALAPPLLGQGAFASVRLDHDARGRRVAVKTYNRERVKANPCLACHLNNETWLASQKLDHEHIIAPHKVSRKPHGVELEMEFAAGGNLGEYVKKSSSCLPEAQARRLFSQIVDAVLYLHHRGIAHCDIKLENIVLDGTHNAKLVDFGAARSCDDLCKSFQGTPAYMAPEFFIPECHLRIPHAAAKADIWSLGILLYTMLVDGCSHDGSRFPFWGKDIDELAKNVSTNVLQFPSSISAQARDLLRGLLCKEPKGRFTIRDVFNHPWLRANGARQTGECASRAFSSGAMPSDVRPKSTVAPKRGTASETQIEARLAKINPSLFVRSRTTRGNEVRATEKPTTSLRSQSKSKSLGPIPSSAASHIPVKTFNSSLAKLMSHNIGRTSRQIVRLD